MLKVGFLLLCIAIPFLNNAMGVDSVVKIRGAKKTITYYNSNKEVIEIKSFQDNVLHGVQKKMGARAQILEVQTFEKGQRIGEHMQYDGFGRLVKQINYDLHPTQGKSVLHGNYKTYHDGKPSITTQYHYGQPIGNWTEYHSNGQLKKRCQYIQFNNDSTVLDKTYEEFDLSGFPTLKGEYRMGKKEGLWRYYRNQGQLTEEKNYTQDLLSGMHTKFSGGEVKYYECPYEIFTTDSGLVSLKQGKEQTWRDKKLELETHYVTGKKHGLEISYLPATGMVTQKTNWFDGALQGIWEDYYPSGKLRNRQRYDTLAKPLTDKRSALQGWSEQYDEGGQLSQRIFWIKGDLFFTERYIDGRCVGKEMPLLELTLSPTLQVQKFGITGITRQPLISLHWYNSGVRRIIGFDDTSWTSLCQTTYSYAGKRIRSSFFQMPQDSVYPTRQRLEAYENCIPSQFLLSKLFTDTIWNGTYTLNYTNGDTLALLHFEDNIPHGEFLIKHPLTADTLLFATYQRGVMVGNYVEKKGGHYTRARGSKFNSGKPHWEWYYNVNNTPHQFTERDEEGNYRVQMRYNEQGQLESYQDESKKLYRHYFDNGKLSQETYPLPDDDSILVTKDYFKNGQLQSEKWRKGSKQVGTYTSYHANGQLASKLQYVEGKAEGEYVEYDSLQQRIHQGQYENGKQQGVWYSQKGGKLDTFYFEEGKLQINPIKKSCACYDTSMSTSRTVFFPALYDLVSKEKIMTLTPPSIQSVDSFNYSKIFYRSFQFSNGNQSGFASMDLVPLKELAYYYPSDKQFKVTLNPGLTPGYRCFIPLTTTYYHGSDDVTLNFSPPHLAFDFLTGPLKSNDPNYPHVRVVLHKPELHFSEKNKITLEHKDSLCVTAGIVRNFLTMQPYRGKMFTASPTYQEAEFWQTDRILNFPEWNRFIGFYSDSTWVTFKININQRTITLQSKQSVVALGGRSVSGVIHFTCKQIATDTYEILQGKNKHVVHGQELKMLFLQQGFLRVETNFDDSKSLLSISFYAE
jgi:antitoxin component YwqK of YwqJK toxin-antitoxin module